VHATGIIRSAIIVLAVPALLLTALWLGQRSLIYFPDRAAPAPSGSAREAILQTSDGLRLVAWLVPPTRGDRKQAVLVTPGNAGHRGHRTALAAALTDAGLTVLLLDYRGYGGNPGSPTEAGLARDASAAVDYLTGTAGFAADRIIYYGESLGAAVATELATRHRPAGLVLRSPFTDLASAGSRHYPWLPVRAMLRDRYPLARHIETVPVPTTVIYGGADSVISPADSRTVAQRAAGPVRVVVLDDADHNDLELIHGPLVVQAVTELADRVGGAR
jgi:hypothetical protein